MDNTKKIIKELAENDYRIRIVQKQNEGQGAARNDGINLAKGKYISFVDADDWLEQNAYKKLIDLAEKNSSDILVFNYNMAYPNGDIKCIKSFKNHNIKLSQTDKNNFLFEYFFGKQIGSSVWNKLYRTDFIKNNGIHMGNTRIGEDFYFNLIMRSPTSAPTAGRTST